MAAWKPREASDRHPSRDGGCCCCPAGDRGATGAELPLGTSGTVWPVRVHAFNFQPKGILRGLIKYAFSRKLRFKGILYNHRVLVGLTITADFQLLSNTSHFN